MQLIVLPETKAHTRLRRELAVAQDDSGYVVVCNSSWNGWAPLAYPTRRHAALDMALSDLDAQVGWDAEKWFDSRY